MDDRDTDRSVLADIQRLADEEHRLYEHPQISEEDSARLNEVKVELDQCWDLLRQRRALRDAGEDPDQAHVRPAEVVEDYVG